MSDDTGLVKRLRQLIKEVGSQRRFARMVGVSDGTVIGWLGGSVPYDRNIAQIAERTSVSLQWLRDGHGNDHAEIERMRGHLRDVGINAKPRDRQEKEPTARITEDSPAYAGPTDTAVFSERLLCDIIEEISGRLDLSGEDRLRLLSPYQSELACRVRQRSEER